MISFLSNVTSIKLNIKRSVNNNIFDTESFVITTNPTPFNTILRWLSLQTQDNGNLYYNLITDDINTIKLFYSRNYKSGCMCSVECDNLNLYNPYNSSYYTGHYNQTYSYFTTTLSLDELMICYVKLEEYNNNTTIKIFLDGYEGTKYARATLLYDDNLERTIFFNANANMLLPAVGISYYISANATLISLTHTVTVTVPDGHGTAQADKDEAESGETVTVTTTPDSGYDLRYGSDGTRIFDANDNEIFPSQLSNTVFTFPMPDSDVRVIVKFLSGNPYLPGGTSTPETVGPQGDFDNTSDNIPIPATPDINYSDSGLVRLFSPTQQQVIAFGNYLWTGLLDFENIIKAFANPMDSLISFHKVPFAVSTDPVITVKFGGLTTSVLMPPVTQQLYEIDCGTIQFPKYYGSAFDYSPYSRAKIYLPYIGEIPLNIDRLIGKTIGVKYKADCFSGTCVAYVTIDGQVYIQQSGSCLLPVPVSMNNYQQFITGGFSLLAGAISNVPQIGAGFGNNIGNAIATNAFTAVKPASDLLQSAFGKPETASSALGGGIAGYLGVQYPYVTITRPKQSLASSFNSMYGYPLNITEYPQNLTGYVKISDITLSDTTATTRERDEIYRLLHDGIVIYNAPAPPEYTDDGQNMKIVFEKYTGRQNAVNKNITTVQELTGTFRDYQSIINPSIRVYGDIGNVINNSNMICIPRLKRRYFIDNVTTNTNNSYELSLRCDVLESFWSDFKGNLAIIERAEKLYNLELNDNLFVAEQRPLFQQLKFPNGFTTTSYILALSGNNGTGE